MALKKTLSVPLSLPARRSASARKRDWAFWKRHTGQAGTGEACIPVSDPQGAVWEYIWLCGTAAHNESGKGKLTSTKCRSPTMKRSLRNMWRWMLPIHSVRAMDAAHAPAWHNAEKQNRSGGGWIGAMWTRGIISSPWSVAPLKKRSRGCWRCPYQRCEQSRGLYEWHQPQLLLRRVYDA